MNRSHREGNFQCKVKTGKRSYHVPPELETSHRKVGRHTCIVSVVWYFWNVEIYNRTVGYVSNSGAMSMFNVITETKSEASELAELAKNVLHFVLPKVSCLALVTVAQCGMWQFFLLRHLHVKRSCCAMDLYFKWQGDEQVVLLWTVFYCEQVVARNYSMLQTVNQQRWTCFMTCW